MLFLFSTGLICGAIGIILIAAFFIPRAEGLKPEKSKTFLVNHYSKQLKLSPEQKTNLKPSFEDLLEKKWLLRADFLEATHELNYAYIESIENQLTPEQKQTAEDIINRLWKEKRRKQMIKNATTAPR